MRLKFQRWRSQRDHMWSDKHFGRHFLIYFQLCVVVFSWNLLQLLITRSTRLWWHFKGHGFRGEGHRHFPIMHFTMEAYQSMVCSQRSS